LSGWDWADFMLGLPSSTSSALGNTTAYWLQNEFGAYVQDSFKARHDLTIEVGLRYDNQPFLNEKYGKTSAYDIAKQALVVPSGLKFVIPSFPQAQVPVLTPSQDGWLANNSSLVNTEQGIISPRFGFAWRPRGASNTAVRGGYGIYRFGHVYPFFGGPGSAAFVGSQSATQSLDANGILSPQVGFPNPFSGFGPTATLSPATISYSTVNPSLKLPMVQQYNLTVEHEWRGWGWRGTYFGDLATGLIYGSNFNEAPPGNQAFAQSRRPIPNAFNITLYQNGGFQRTNGFQADVRHPTSHGLAFDGAWTWLKCLGDVVNGAASYGDTPYVPLVGSGGYYNRRRFTSNCGVPPRQQALFRWSWIIPAGRGQKYLNNAHPVIVGILGGASVFQTGQWLTPSYVGVDPAGMTPGTGSQLPDRVANGNFPRSQRNGYTAPYFDTSAFVCPGGSTINGQPNLLTAGCPLSTPQNVGRLGNSALSIIEGPGVNTWNMAITKQFPLRRREGTNLEFAAQMANPWNHPTVALPSVVLSSPSSVGRFTSGLENNIQPWSYAGRKISLETRINF
jgi:hypothetical protein